MDTSQIEVKLRELRTELQSRVRRTHKHTYGKEEPVSSNFHEQAKEKENDELVQILESEGLDEIEQIEAALARIEHGTYGKCQNCGNEIDKDRLFAIPYTKFCIGCAVEAS